MAQPLVLLTDDDRATLAAYERRLRRHFRLILAKSGQEAINILQTEVPDVVVSDLHMPEMNGMTLLTEVRSQAPSTLRILLTGDPSLSSAIDAINTGEVFRLLLKPCPSEAMIAAIDEGLGRKAKAERPDDPGELTDQPELMLTTHARRRLQNRAIPPIVVDWLMRFGCRRWSRGAAVYEFDKESRRRLRRHVGQRLFGAIEPFLDAYVVVGGEQKIVTVGWRQPGKRRLK